MPFTIPPFPNPLASSSLFPSLCPSMCTPLGIRIGSDSDSDNKQEDPPVNEADLKDNKGEPKESKLLEEENGEGSKKTKEEEKEVVKTPGDEPGGGVSTKYKLRGVVVHSGQASGGHYYSFIHLRCVSVIVLIVVAIVYCSVQTPWL